MEVQLRQARVQLRGQGSLSFIEIERRAYEGVGGLAGLETIVDIVGPGAHLYGTGEVVIDDGLVAIP